MKGAAWGAALLVSALAFLPFLSTLGGQFLNWDDGINFVTNPGFRGLGWAQLRWMATTTLLGHWIPFTWLSLGVNYVLGNAAEAERLRQEATELRAAMLAARRSVEIPGRDRETVRP